MFRTCCSFVLFIALASAVLRPDGMSSQRAPLLSIEGNQLVGLFPGSSSWKPFQRRGVSGTGALFECVQNRGLWDGPIDQAYMDGMKTWHVGIVRVPMNEDCWLGINGVNANYSGTTYQTAMKSYVKRLIANGFNVILELHWTAPGRELALGQKAMPDEDHAPEFWRTVGHTFGQDREVIFDLFNEPFPGDNTIDSLPAWDCWKYGTYHTFSNGTNATFCPDVPFSAVGMDDLVQLLRSPSVNATNVLMLGGINYSNSLVRWVESMPHDPLKRIAASWHSYSPDHCNAVGCWKQTIAPVMRQVPVITGELGEVDCRGIYIRPLMAWLDSSSRTGASYLAWLWAPWNCEKGPALITNYSGGCTDSYGCDYRNHLLARAKLEL